MIEYACSNCSASDCKLWIEDAENLDKCLPVCTECIESIGVAVEDYGDVIGLEADGFLPAMPGFDGKWQHPMTAKAWWLAWWDAMPTRRSQCTECCGSGKKQLQSLLSASVKDVNCVACDGTGVRKKPEETL